MLKPIPAPEARDAFDRARKLWGLPPVVHGTLHGRRSGCFCLDCIEAKRQRDRDERERRVKARTPRRAHGTLGGWTNWGCRCKRCRAAHEEYEEAQKSA